MCRMGIVNYRFIRHGYVFTPSRLLMPDFQIVARIEAEGVRSLVWEGATLVDWAGGNRRFELDGEARSRSITFGHRFDVACVSASGKYVVLYVRQGTKGLVLKEGQLIREINRSYYYAEVYEYPVCFAQRQNGQEVLIHCPDQYNQLEIEDVESGERLTKATDRKPIDFFHSRLSVDPTSTYLLSAGWIWHPLDFIALFDLEACLYDPRLLDKNELVPPAAVEISSAAFVGANRLVFNTSDESFMDDDYAEDEIEPNHVGIWDIPTTSLIRKAPVKELLGTLLPIGENYVVGFYQHPKIVKVATGEVIAELPGLATGKQDSSIIHHIDAVPPLAIDPLHQRFAVANDKEIVVVEVSE